MKLGPYQFAEDDHEMRRGDLEVRQPFVDKFGHTYVGECLKGTDIKQGRGVIVFNYGRVYEGYWLYDKQSGVGRGIWPDGSHYVGQFQNGAWHGKGTYVWADGKKYEGEFFKGNSHGQGTYSYTDGSVY